MTSLPDTITAWQMMQPPTRNRETGTTIPGRLELVQIPVPELAPGEVLVEIAGCGVCPADIDLFHNGVTTDSRLPLTLGQEIAGTVVAGEVSWLGREVLLPPVTPCGHCPICQAGRGDLCPAPTRPGRGIYGGYASHIPVAAASLCPITNRRTIPLEHIAAVADTVATAFQAASRAAIATGDRVIVIGAGETGPFVVQMAKVCGAATVLVVDRGADRLAPLLALGADYVVDDGDQTAETTAAAVRQVRAANGLAATGWKIFETTGTGAGREIALALLDRTDTLIVIGSAPAAEVAVLDCCAAAGAEGIATRGCPPDAYPRVVDLVTSGKIALSPFVQTRPMSWVREVFAAGRALPADKHTILTADDIGLEFCPEAKSCR